MDTALIISLLFIGVLSAEITGQPTQSSLCTKPQEPKNGQVTCVPDPNGVLKCYATCNSGYTFQSTSVEFRTCNKNDGSWPAGNSFPDCTATNSKCQSLSPPKNGIVKCETVNSTLVCTARCNEKYVFPGRLTTVKRVCEESIGWKSRDTIPDCTVDCNSHYLISSNDNITHADFLTSSVLSQNGQIFSPKKSDMFCVGENCGWRPSSSDLNQFVQINLRTPSRLLGIATKGLTNGASEIYVTRFRILHSMDGRNFVPYSDENVMDKFFSGNSDGNSPHTQEFSCPFQAQYVRINPLEWHREIGFRFELLGCSESSVAPTGSPVTVSPKFVPDGHTTTVQQANQGITQKPDDQCSALLPPANGAVNCQQSSSELLCNSICNDGFQFTTKKTVSQLTCDLVTGNWTSGTNFPACIPVQKDQLTTLRPPLVKCVSTQSNCNVFGNGDYNTCGDCRYFATCSEGVVYIRACPNNLLFNAATGTCEFSSLTCQTSFPFG